jgi:hypothetical protein
MPRQKGHKFGRHLNLLSLSIPVGAFLASAAFPLSVPIRQALVGVILIWFEVQALTGFQFER